LIGASAYNTSSTDASVGAGDETMTIADRFGSIDANFDRIDDRETVRPLLQALPERDRTLLTLRFFENMSQSQIAERLGVSQMHVSRLLAKALATLREQIE
jgi:RNA polymerase sigma-B factor